MRWTKRASILKPYSDPPPWGHGYEMTNVTLLLGGMFRKIDIFLKFFLTLPPHLLVSGPTESNGADVFCVKAMHANELSVDSGGTETRVKCVYRLGLDLNVDDWIGKSALVLTDKKMKKFICSCSTELFRLGHRETSVYSRRPRNKAGYPLDWAPVYYRTPLTMGMGTFFKFI